MAILKAKGLSKTYQMGELTVTALREASFEIQAGELIVVLGPSGSGKSTLLNIMGGMDQATFGEFYYRDLALHHASRKELTLYRRQKVGFVFQFYNLIPNLTALENIHLATQIVNEPLSAIELLRKINLEERAAHFPNQLSGGEQQRIAIARALAKNPEVLLCDEPTGSLDFKTGIQILQLLRDFGQNYGTTIVLITHNTAIAPMANRVFHLSDGVLKNIEINQEPLAPSRVNW